MHLVKYKGGAKSFNIRRDEQPLDLTKFMVVTTKSLIGIESGKVLMETSVESDNCFVIRMQQQDTIAIVDTKNLLRIFWVQNDFVRTVSEFYLPQLKIQTLEKKEKKLKYV